MNQKTSEEIRKITLGKTEKAKHSCRTSPDKDKTFYNSYEKADGVKGPNQNHVHPDMKSYRTFSQRRIKGDGVAKIQI